MKILIYKKCVSESLMVINNSIDFSYRNKLCIIFVCGQLDEMNDCGITVGDKLLTEKGKLFYDYLLDINFECSEQEIEFAVKSILFNC